MLGSPHHGLIGCRDLEATTQFLIDVGFTEVRDDTYMSDSSGSESAGTGLYGLGHTVAQRWLTVPDWPLGAIRLVQTPHANSRNATTDRGAYAFDVYSSDIERSRRELTARSYHCGKIARLNFGAPFAQMRVDGPDGLRVIIVESPRRRSVLDRDKDRLHSEAQSFVFVVGDPKIDDSFWQPAGLTPLMSGQIPASEALIDLLDLPSDTQTMGIGLFWNSAEGASTTRLELLSFAGQNEATQYHNSTESLNAGKSPTTRITTGLNSVCFEVDDIEAAAQQLGSSRTVSIRNRRGQRLLTSSGISPAGVNFELWSQPVKP